MNLLPKVLGIIFIFFLLTFPRHAAAVTIAQQTQVFTDQGLIVWQMIQELGSNLSGTASTFTFRVSTSRSNQNQFNFTALNSKIYDKDNNSSFIGGCVTNSSDPINGLTFQTSGMPSGYEDVTIDFSCRNYNFIQGHRYLIKISNANSGNSGSGQIVFGAVSYINRPNTDYFPDGGLRYANGNGFDYSNNSGSCDPAAYSWGGTNPFHNGCYVWTTSKDDIYFVLSNNALPPPPPRLPVVFIPGIGGSEMKASQDIIWSKDDGHGGTYSHAYASNEKIWVNQDEAAKLGNDDYFDVLKLKSDGQTSEASLNLTGNLTSFGYGDIDPFFTGMGYVKGTNFFVFPYDWRKDVRGSKDALDSLIETAKTSSGQSKVNLVVHSMGGLIARYYISDSAKAGKVNKLIELGVPHLGTPFSLKTLMYGIWLARDLYLFKLGIVPSEIKDVFQNLPTAFQLLPSSQYFSFYNNSDRDHPYPFRDDRDIDSNNVKGVLNYDQTKSLLTNLNYNMTVFGMGEQLHSSLDLIFNQTNGIKVYEIVGSSQPTLGQIQETWWVNWPINLISKQDELFINGDDTVPLYSASLKSDSLDISGAYKIYYVEQKHTDLVSQNGTAMQTVKSILNDDNAIPSDARDQKILLEGQQISVDDADLDLYDDNNNHTGINSSGDVETNIADTFYDSLGKTKHVFVKKKAVKKPIAKITSTKSTKTRIKIRNYSQDSIIKTIYFNDVPVTSGTPVQFTIDPTTQTAPTLTSGTQTILATSEATGSAALDQTPPTTSIQISGTKDSSGIYTGPVTITLTGSDTGSGILRIEYSLDNGQTVQIYSGPFTISTPGKTTIQVKSIDKLGNEEIPQTITVEIAPTPTSSPTPILTSTSITDSDSGDSSSTSTTADTSSTALVTTNTPLTTLNAPSVSSPEVLGIEFINPNHISDQINIEKILEQDEKQVIESLDKPSAKEILNGLVIVSGGIIALASLGFVATFLYPTPK